MNPLMIAYYPLKYKDTDFLMRNRREIEWLLGVQLPKADPEKAYRIYREKMGKIMRLVSEKCVKEKGGTTCIYKYKDNVTKEFIKSPILSACRGTVIRWYDNGEAIRLAFPFAKFFNLHEVPMTEKLPEENGVIYEKLDGTLVSCWVDEDGEIRCSTRGMLDNMKAVVGRTKVYMEIGENPIINAFMDSINRNILENLVKENITVMFELLGDRPASQCPNVENCLSNPKPYLLARRIGDGSIEYIEYEGIPSPRKFNYKIGELAEIVREIKDMEGFVVHYPNLKYHPGVEWWDYLVKVKSYLYVMKSEILWGSANTLNYRSLARLVIVSGAPDDVISLFPEEKEFIIDVWDKWNLLKDEYMDLVEKTTEKTLRILRGQNYGWLASLLEESRKRGISPLKRFIIKGMPRSKEAIPSYMDRIRRRIIEVKKITNR